jgi:SAM-dependent methyltransferase
VSVLLRRLDGRHLRPLVPLSNRQRIARDTVAAYPLDTPLPCLCGGVDDQIVARQDRYGLAITTQICRACGLLRSDPYYSEATLTTFYTETYRALYAYEDGDLTPDKLFARQQYKGSAIITYLRGVIGAVPQRVIEIGCGAGGILRAFQDAGSRVAGCDLNSEYLAFGCAQGLDLRYGGLETLPDTAELIILSHVLEHVRAPVDLLRAIRGRWPAASLYVELPGVFAIRISYRDEPAHFFQNAHCWGFSEVTLTTVLGAAGYARQHSTPFIRGLFRAGPILPFQRNAGHASEIARELCTIERTRHVRTFHDYVFTRGYQATRALLGPTITTKLGAAIRFAMRRQ